VNQVQLDNLFSALPPTRVEHFKLYYYAAVLHLLEQVVQSFGSREDAFEQFPFLVGYHDELAVQGLDGPTLSEAMQSWSEALLAWEEAIPEHLPLRAISQATGLDYSMLTLLLTIGLIEEDARFGLIFEALQSAPGQHRPTLGLLNAWWREPVDRGEVRSALLGLQALGLVQVINPEAPRIEWALQIPGPLWDAMRGDTRAAITRNIDYKFPGDLPLYDDLIIPEQLRTRLSTLSSLLSAHEVQAVVVRGPQHNGRRTLLGAIARQLGRGLLVVEGPGSSDDERWRFIGPLATLLHALPAIVLEPTAGEIVTVPRLQGYSGPLGIVLGKYGGISGPGLDRTIALVLDMPGPDQRRLHWQRGFQVHKDAVEELDAISERLRMTSGNIWRSAQLAHIHAAQAGRTTVTLADVREGRRALHHQSLETLTSYIPAIGDWSHLAVRGETMREVCDLESRCRHRERLSGVVGTALAGQLNTGVRALFGGPSGTGKTLAARILASVLQMDLYRIDLSAVVNKYIGETEKHLNQVFARAEELDVILLLDEGDALLTRRTNVQSSNDRYANLETNYLLQRLESYEGILIVTTNAGDRIDRAFQRRMDVVIDFRPPDVAERWLIWQLHLPATHTIDTELLQEVAERCEMSGGQIRNAVLHASLLALNDDGLMRSSHLEAAVQREYRKIGSICPVRWRLSLEWR
jgi:ATPase family protein associated with various cellular activities (AAA)